ncbi:phosphoesterase [Pseudodesulfovibrio sp. JC047]|uniref:DHH family phosphoesterase n=1 Tax=Pseudodesulfovibrio sp. JC047 TaxID=2683199 RepID=UPI0013D1AF2B|nr:DHH family phosphoesterase [Pseudodesulfovibrio sp. JC047]NDV19504.1 phosphoesterase [Pseudodesulfovibrio sp. JC047]
MALFRQLDEQVEHLLELFTKDDNWLIVINADPDALGSALALRRIMARRVNRTAIAQINEIKRPDNLSMIRYCRIPTQKLTPTLAVQFDKFALVDSQPHHNPEFKQFDFSVVIDHHPIAEDNLVEAEYVDIRPKYGSVCTMMTEYLYNMKIRPAKLLATALMYGIRCDTKTFERKFIDADMAAFKFLSKFADSKLMNRISRSEFHLDWMRYISRAFYNLRRVGKGLFSYCGNVENPDILVIVADFFTRVHDVPWVVVSGTSEDKLVCILRGDGQRRDMGTMAQKLMNGLGSAGGHKQAARAEVPIEELDGVDPEIFMLKRIGQGRKATIRKV